MSPETPKDPGEDPTGPAPTESEQSEQAKPAAATGSAPPTGPSPKKPRTPRRRRSTRKAEAEAVADTAGEDAPDQPAAGGDPAPPQDSVTEDADSEAAPRRRRSARPKSEPPPATGPTPTPTPAPTRRRSGATERRAVVRARARYVRTSARKARMVSGHLRGKSVEEARAILAFTPRDVARDWSKLLESAVANAENNHELVGDDLVVREAYADEGPTIKRFRPRAMGRATPIRKRTSHLTITLTPR
jgi:ribosomal protein L22